MASLTYCHCAALRVGHWHIVTGVRVIAAPIRSRQFLDVVLKHLGENSPTITLAREVRDQIKFLELTRWERSHLSDRALRNLCRVSGG